MVYHTRVWKKWMSNAKEEEEQRERERKRNDSRDPFRLDEREHIFNVYDNDDVDNDDGGGTMGESNKTRTWKVNKYTNDNDSQKNVE